MSQQPIDVDDIHADSLNAEQLSLLLSLPHEDLIDLYNDESKRIARGLEVHMVDYTCKPLYIVKLFARLPIRYAMMRAEASNERAAMAPASEEKAERKSTKAESRREKAGLTHGSKPFTLLH
jgi:hypothetical protein